MVSELVRTDLSRALETAARRGPRPESASSLRPALTSESTIDLSDVLNGHLPPGGAVPVGLVDEPKRQRQSRLLLNLHQGAALFLGGASSGKTTSLVTVIHSFMRCNPSGYVVAIDGGNGDLLKSARNLNAGYSVQATPHLVTRTIDRLWALSRQTECDPILVVVDQMDALTASLATTRGLFWYQRLLDLVGAGRSAGIYFALTASRPQAIPPDLHALTNAVITFTANETPDRGDIELGAGIGTIKTSETVQIAQALDSPPTTRSAQLMGLFDETRTSPPRTPAVTFDDDSAFVRVGIDLVTKEPVQVELGWRHLLVTGRPKSGKTRFLNELAYHLSIDQARKIAYIAGRPRNRQAELPPQFVHLDLTRLTELKSNAAVANSSERETFIDRVFEECASDLLRFDSQHGANRLLIVVDDLQAVERDIAIREFLEICFNLDRACLVMATDVGGASPREWMSLKMHSSQTIFLQPTSTTEFDDGARFMSDALRLRPNAEYAPGEGIFYDHGSQTEIQLYEETTSAEKSQ